MKLFYKLFQVLGMKILVLWCLLRTLMGTILSSSDYNYINIANSSSISMSRDGSVYSAISNNNINYYRKIDSKYILMGTFYPDCIPQTVTNCVVARQTMAYDGSRIVSYSTNDNFVRVYKIVNDSIKHSQYFAATGGLQTRFQVKENFLLLSSNTNMQFYNFNQTSQLYQLIYNGSYPTPSNGVAAVFSTDGKYILTYNTSFLIYIYTYDGVTFTVPNTTYQIPLPNGSISHINDFKIQQLNSTAYSLIISFLIGTNRYLNFYSMTGGVISFEQQIDYTNNSYFQQTYLTKNAKYLSQGRIPNSLKFYEFDSNINQYVLVFQSFLGSTSTPNNVYITQDASFLYVTSGSDTTFYFKCSLPYCSNCLSLSQCLICNSTFTRTSNFTCACSSTQTLFNSSCFNCNITLCSSCSASNVCSSCGKGFSLVLNTCLCPSGSSISLDGSCVSCNVAGCLRCDQPNTCALFTPSASSTSPSSTSTSSDGKTNDQKALLALLVVILTLLVIGMSYLFIKIKQILNTMQKVDGTQKNGDLQNNEQIDKTICVLPSEGDVPLAHFNDQILLKESSTLEMKGPQRMRRRKMRNQETTKFTQEENVSKQIVMEIDLD